MLRTLLLLAGLAFGARAGFTQDVVSPQGPRFLASIARPARTVEIDPATVPILQRRVTLTFERTTVGAALAEVSRQVGIQLVYSRDVFDPTAPIRIKVDRITVAAALTELLLGRGVDVVLSGGNRVTLAPRWARTAGGAIHGRVVDAKTGKGLAATAVLLGNTRWQATSDTGGRYRLADVDAGQYTLIARRFGYTPVKQTVTVRENQDDTVMISLEPMALRLDELVSTATGRQRRLEVASDITVLKADSIVRTQPVTSVTDILENRVPGLTVQRTSGAPGDPGRVRLRGASSPLRGNDPIVVVDGVRVYSDQSGPYGGNLAQLNLRYGTAAPSPLDYIDPNTIETIEIVKGPSASTLYGPDAANGVILITTKKGHAGPTLWNFMADYNSRRMAGRYPDLLLRWGHSTDLIQPVICPISNIAWPNTPCQGDSATTFQLLNDPGLTVLDKGRDLSTTLGVSGGSSTIRYAVNGSYQDQVGLVKLPTYEVNRFQTLEGFTPPDWMQHPQRYKYWGATSAISMNLGPKAEVSLTATLSRLRQQKSTLEDQLGSLMSTFLDQNTGIYYSSDLGAASATEFGIKDFRTRLTAAATQFTNAVNANWRPRSWLTLSAQAGLNVDHRDDESFYPRSRDSTFNNGNTGFLSLGSATSVVSTLNLRGLTTVPIGGGMQFRFGSGVDYTGTSYNVTNFNTSRVPFGTELIGTSISSPLRDVRNDATFGWYVEPSLNHPRYSINLGLRLDGGNSYGGKLSGFKLPTFPKLGFSYLISDERFFPLKDLFQSLRLRMAYGRASRQPGLGDRLRLYTVSEQGLSDNGVADIVELKTLGNTELRPERSTELEGGFDAQLLNNRLTVIFSGYRKTTDDALLQVPVPPSVYGVDITTWRNIGLTRNTGMDLDATATLLQNQWVTWNTRLVLSRRRDEVVRLGPGVQPFYTDGNPQEGGTRIVAGYPLFGRWTRPVLGYADANSNGVLESSEVLLGDTAVYVGQQLPNYTAALEPSVSLWHGALTVTGTFAYSNGLSQENEVGRNLAPFSRGTNDPAASLAEQLVTGTAVVTDYNWIQTVSTTRFDALSVMYTLPTSLAQRVGAQRVSVAFQGRNLGLWSNYRGLDPNVNAYATGNSVTDTGVLPMPRIWQLRINATY